MARRKAKEKDEILATLEASAPRRWFGVSSLGGLAVVIGYVAATEPPESFALLCFLGGFSLASGLLAWKMWSATGLSLVLTREGLHDSGGRLIFETANLAGVEKGIFAFKPSNGFLVKLRERETMGWAPGMWWRLGKMVGIGGIAPGPQARMMADLLIAISSEMGNPD